MYFRAIAGLVSGLAAGVISGIIFLLMSMPDVDGVAVPLLTVVSRAVGYDDPAVGWSFHLFNSTLVGLVFGLIAGRHVVRMVPFLGMGLVTGLIWWVVSGMLMLPTLMGYPAMATLSVPALHPVLYGTLIGSLVYGILLGAGFVLLYLPVDADERRVAQLRQREEEEERELTAGRR